MTAFRKSVTKLVSPLSRYHVYSGHLPANKEVILKWKHSMLQTVRSRTAKEKLLPPVHSLATLIDTDPTIGQLVDEMLRQNIILQNSDAAVEGLGEIKDLDDFLGGINEIIQGPPPYMGKYLIGVPLSAFLSGVNATQAGQSFFCMPSVNNEFNKILKHWNLYLSDESLDSNSGFLEEDKGWLSTEAKKKWLPDLFARDSETHPWYKTWNSYFTRQLCNREVDRPVSGIGDASIVTAPNDGMLFRWRSGVKASDKFWFKDMPYSLSDIFRTQFDDEQQKIFDDHRLVERFKNGSIFQSFLSPFDYHRWWTPVSGRVVFEPQIIPGAYYAKLDIPDIEGTTASSLSYLAEVNCRGILVLDTDIDGGANIGYVCCVLIGMVEVSGIEFKESVKKGAYVTKGDELGYFSYDGSSVAVIFEDVANYDKVLSFISDRPVDGSSLLFPSTPEIPNPMGTVGTAVRAGMQIAVISD